MVKMTHTSDIHTVSLNIAVPPILKSHLAPPSNILLPVMRFRKVHNPLHECTLEGDGICGSGSYFLLVPRNHKESVQGTTDAIFFTSAGR